MYSGMVGGDRGGEVYAGQLNTNKALFPVVDETCMALHNSEWVYGFTWATNKKMQ